MKAKHSITLRHLTEGAMIAAVYTVLTYLLWTFSSMQIQVRVSEALCILPLFTPAAVPGLTLGCLLANLLGGGNLWDVIFGTLATLLASLATYGLGRCRGKWVKWVSPLPSVLFNAFIIPFVLYFGYGFTTFGETVGMAPVLALSAFTVAAGQFIACYGLGLPLYAVLKRVKLFPETE